MAAAKKSRLKKSPNENESARLDAVSLQKEIDKRMADSRVSSNDLSFNELLDMYREGELIITPEFQRTFRWSLEQQSRFVESLILELPIPPIFLVELEAGQVELVDGLQRISSYLHFRGLLPERWAQRDKERILSRYDEDDTPAESLPDDEISPDDPSVHPPETPKDFLELQGCEIVEGLNGMTFRDLPTATQIALKRYFVRTFTVRRASHRDLKYHMFKRLNQGGSPLKEQELRNCFIRIVGEEFIRFINRCSRKDDFWKCVRSISQNAAEQLYHQELVLRFFAFKNDRESYMHDVGPFLDSYLEGVSSVGGRQLHFDYKQEGKLFDRTFALLSRATAEDTFRATHPATGTPTGFRSLLFEAISLGIQDVVPYLNPQSPEDVQRLGQILRKIKQQDAFRKLTTGGGKNYSRELDRRIDFVNNALKKEFAEFF